VFQLCDSDALALFTTLMNTWLVTVLIDSFRKSPAPTCPQSVSRV